MNSALWMTMPYIAFTSFVLGHVWRYRTDQFGWTTRSSQIYECRLLRMGSPLFHFGLLGVFGGHVVGLLVPESWTSAVGISEYVYHLMSVTLGSLAGFAVVTGLGILLYRRITVPAVRRVTTRNDKLMYLLLVAALLTGMVNTLTNVVATYNYRDTVSPWFRSLFSLHPAPELMASAPPTFQVHAVIVLALLGIWPYTRLVHMFSAPVGYLLRPHVIYRSPDLKRPGSHRYSKAWVAPEAPPVRSKWV
ncbi:MAG: respiratory nitrate reductase subunit gamma [Mycobacterium pseudokansasii]|uniref:Nitrate reductase-like protein NarX n=2 Tax=Mycobacterium TaxID=1763 RepID=A0A498QWW4_9MYCO|nr:respiratory nitrate reductase subunit gamma [Mycobacterium pseudokansasii]KZS66370.1 nitrate reductase [Mycobacterium kansasii]MBY0389756.1 respiratory nitrate reductase subunit gamma [Mycobacterium pseudokansasii]VAZ97947.1 Nitrate reductase-like protein NarX [Mycobacterium pseudokansasii]VAZ99486.1 Nitrate reductase-like protein NarX [Mycobacterium pseudokansasii]VBA52901.1 Nitrate reductase-like protein NarX [Mycobacterium pseudokansasii]